LPWSGRTLRHAGAFHDGEEETEMPVTPTIQRPPIAQGPLCAEPECAREAAARGLCNLHYKQHRRAGTLPPALSLADRLWARVTKAGACWEWTGSVNALGWGYISDQGKTRLVHRVAYELLLGPIPEGVVIRHRCGNPRCVRPEHLDPHMR
jgi:hypothetical protein